MGSIPGFVHRYTRILDALEVLRHYPDGLPLAQLADELRTPVDDLRTEILAYYTAEPAVAEHYRLPGIAWLSPSGEEEDPRTAEVIVLTEPGALAELGAARLTVQDMAGIWRAGRVLLDYEPNNEALASALEVLAAEWLEGPEADAEPGADQVATIRGAIEQRRRLRFRYERQWRPGISDREIDPYRLSRTSRGWELDAGPLDADGAPRTFLLANITSEVEVLSEHFAVPDGIERIIAANRAQLRVEVSLPQRVAWSVESQADASTPLRADEETVTDLVELSPPYPARLALILAPAMGEGMLMSHRELAPQINEHAARLLAHHGFAIP
jgi:hypothetical protein